MIVGLQNRDLFSLFLHWGVQLVVIIAGLAIYPEKNFTKHLYDDCFPEKRDCFT
jgi:hypothetical protein